MADYLVNLEAYKKACVNKSKPMMHCNGKCQMLKKMKKQEGNNDANTPTPKFNESEVVLSSKSFFPSINVFSSLSHSKYFIYKEDISSNFLGSIFHPPGV